MYCFILFVIFLYLISKYFLRTLKIQTNHDKYVMITGCDTGFGNLLAKRLDYLRLNVFAGCLTEAGREKLNNVTSHRITTFLIDVKDDESITNACAFVKSRLPYGRGLHGLVNNAGIFNSLGLSMAEWSTIDDYKKLMDVNRYGMVRVTTTFLPLVRAERGRIVNMSSLSGRLAVGGGPYSCSKYAVESYSDTLRHELYAAGISVSIIEPSGYSTGLTDFTKMGETTHSKFNGLDADIREYFGEEFPQKVIDNTRPGIALSGRLYEVVDAYNHALSAKYPQGRYVVGKDTKTFFRLLWNAPEWFTSAFLGTFNWPEPKAISDRRYRSLH